MTLINQLAALESAELIRVAQTHPELAYLFRHALVQEAAYGSLLKNHRRALHRAVGEMLEQLYPDRVDELAPVLAHHFAEAEDAARALDYFTRAGEQAARKHANAEAVMHYTRALEIAQDAGATLTAAPDVAQGRPHGLKDHLGLSLQVLFLKRGRAQELLGRFDDALANYGELETLAHARHDRALELAALTARATIRSTPTDRFDAVECEALSRRAIEMARELGDRQAEAKSFWNLALLYRIVGDWNKVVEYGEQSVAIAREFNLREQLAFALNDVSGGYLSTGQMARARAMLDEALSLWRELRNPPMLADCLTNAAEIDWFSGQLARGRSLAEESNQLSRAIGNLWG